MKLREVFSPLIRMPFSSLDKKAFIANSTSDCRVPICVRACCPLTQASASVFSLRIHVNASGENRSGGHGLAAHVHFPRSDHRRRDIHVLAAAFLAHAAFFGIFELAVFRLFRRRQRRRGGRRDDLLRRVALIGGNEAQRRFVG